MDARGAEAMAVAIVKQAVVDWYANRDTILYGIGPNATYRDGDVYNPEKNVQEIERFLTSKWFNTLSNLDGRKLLEAMREGPQIYFFRNGVYEREGRKKYVRRVEG